MPVSFVRRHMRPLVRVCCATQQRSQRRWSCAPSASLRGRAPRPAVAVGLQGRVVGVVEAEEVCKVSLYKILFYFKALVWESIILFLPPPPPAKPTLLQYYRTPIAQYTPRPPHRPPVCMADTIQY